MEYQAIILFANTFVNLSLGLIVWLRGARRSIHKVFIIFTISISLWSFSLAMFFINSQVNIALLWAKIIYFAGSMIALSLCYFSFIFPQPYLKGKQIVWMKLALLVPSIAIFIVTLTTQQVIGGIDEGIYKGLVFSKLYGVWAFHFIAFMVIAFINLFIQYNRFYRTEKLQLKYVLIGTLSAAIFGTFTNLVLPTFGNFKYFSIGPLLTISMAGFIAYAIVKHRLLDIRLVIARAIAYSLLVVIIGVIYILAAFGVSSFLLNGSAGRDQLIIYSILTLIIAFSFERLRLLIEKVTDSIFFRGHYDSNQLLSSLGYVMSTTIELMLISTRILEILTSQMRITRGVFILLEENKFYEIIATGFASKPSYSYEQLMPLLNCSQITVFDELEEGDIKQLMRELNISISITLCVKESNVGLLLLGEKLSGEIYSDQDLKVLNILAPEIAIAVQNAQSYDKIKKFNITLSEEVRKATYDLQVANRRLQELDKLKDDFVSVASHELRTPMTAIKSYLWMALHKSDIELSEKVKKYLNIAYISTERLINLVNDMLNVSRIEGGRIEINPQICSVHKLVDEVITEITAKALEKNINLSVSSDQVPDVFADPDKVHQILLNLLGNSLKFTPAYGTIKVEFFSDGKVVEISVKDSGVGISPDDMSHLFQKFGRLENSYEATATSGGTGLGLYISKKLVEMMGGKIWARSEGVGKGSTFTFTLPVATRDILLHTPILRIRRGEETKHLEPVAI